MEKTLSTPVAVVATTLLLLISVYQTTTTTTAATITTTTTTSDNEGRLSSRCERQIRRPIDIEHCQQYLRSEMDVLMYPNSGNQACCLRECCDMLQDMDEECACEVVRELGEEERERIMSRRGEEGRRQMGRMVIRKAMELPQRCGVTARRCEPTTTTTTYY